MYQLYRLYRIIRVDVCFIVLSIGSLIYILQICPSGLEYVLTRRFKKNLSIASTIE